MEFKLILKKIKNNLSKEEEVVFLKWFNESDLHKEYFNKVKKNFNNDSLSVDIEKGWNAIEQQIKPSATKRKSYIKYAIAASLALFVGLGQYVYKTTFDEGYITEKAIKNIKPGSKQAVLILADGSEVDLGYSKKEVITNNTNAVVSNTATGLVYKANNDATELKEKSEKFNTLFVPVGGIYNIELSDGTKVWLNSASSLKFPVTFNGNERVVTLQGEAYFDVTKSSKKFIVKTNTADVTVLGTEFNVSTYLSDDEFTTTLIEGKVRLTGTENSVILSPNQQGIVRSNHKNIEVENVDAEMIATWKDGKFYFKKESLDKILARMNRWYDVEVAFEDESIKQEKFTGVVLKNKPIDYLLNIICETTNLKYSITKNKTTQKYEIKISRK